MSEDSNSSSPSQRANHSNRPNLLGGASSSTPPSSGSSADQSILAALGHQGKSASASSPKAETAKLPSSSGSKWLWFLLIALPLVALVWWASSSRHTGNDANPIDLEVSAPPQSTASGTIAVASVEQPVDNNPVARLENIEGDSNTSSTSVDVPAPSDASKSGNPLESMIDDSKVGSTVEAKNKAESSPAASTENKAKPANSAVATDISELGKVTKTPEKPTDKTQTKASPKVEPTKPAAAPPAPAAAKTEKKAIDRDVEVVSELLDTIDKEHSNNDDNLPTVASVIKKCEARGQTTAACRKKNCDGFWGTTPACPLSAKEPQSAHDL